MCHRSSGLVKPCAELGSLGKSSMHVVDQVETGGVADGDWLLVRTQLKGLEQVALTGAGCPVTITLSSRRPDEAR